MLNGEKKLAEIIKEIGAAASNGEAKKLIEGKAVRINGEVVNDAFYSVKEVGSFDLAVGKKKFFRVNVK